MTQHDILELLTRYKGKKKLDAKEILQLLDDAVSPGAVRRKLKKMREFDMIHWKEIPVPGKGTKHIHWVGKNG